ncbi:MAG: ACT domain-containing protein [Anaerolineales bacterium]|nr:MAG: ACT domain-containing protein [Anaerolineales bacterium]
MGKKTQIGGIMHSDGLAMIGALAMPSRPGIAGKILSTMGDNEVNVQFIVQMVDTDGNDHVVFCVDRKELDRVLELLAGIKEAVSAQDIVHDASVGLVSIFGPDFRQRPGIAGEMFAALGQADINIQAISTSISTISCVIQATQVPEAVKTLQNTFEMP